MIIIEGELIFFFLMNVGHFFKVVKNGSGIFVSTITNTESVAKHIPSEFVM